MTLMEITRRLYEVDPEQTIYAKKPWYTTSEAVFAMEPEGTLIPASLAAEGYSYFLEVFIAKDVIPSLSHVEPSYSLEKWCERLIQYAENDA
jgi:hypothetical protein